MQMLQNRDVHLVIRQAEKLTLPFVPVCDLIEACLLPFIPGSRLVTLDFSPPQEEKTGKGCRGLI